MVRQLIIAIVMPRVQTRDLEHLSVHVMRVSAEMEHLVQVCLKINYAHFILRLKAVGFKRRILEIEIGRK